MNFRVRLIVVGLSTLLLNSCAATTNPVRSGPEIYRVGKVEVRLYRDRAEMVKDLPASVSWLDSARMGSVRIKLCGYFDREKNRMYAIDDARILLHEFKHYLEPNWEHNEETPTCNLARTK